MLSEEWKAAEPEEPAAEMILQDMKAEEFAESLRKLEYSVDDDFFWTVLPANDGENAQNGSKIQRFGP